MLRKHDSRTSHDRMNEIDLTDKRSVFPTTTCITLS